MPDLQGYDRPFRSVHEACRIDRLAAGNPGDAKPVGGGISELRIDDGPGCRVPYLREGERLVLLLCGGDKSTQTADIAAAHDIARQWRANRGGDR